MNTLNGKWIWLWNWRRCDGGDPARVAERLKAAGCAGALVKAWDGPRWFDQSATGGWREIARALKAHGLAAGGWGYCYGRDAEEEAERAIETGLFGEADLLVLDVESEFKGRPDAAEELCAGIREVMGPEYPLYFSSFAIARYHRSFPFEVFRRHCTGAAPQVYWNAFRWPLEQSLGWTYEDYAALGIPPSRVFPVGGLYQEGFVRYPDTDDVRAFIRGPAGRGSSGVSFWSYEHMDGEMWQAVAAESISGAPEEEDEMSSEEYVQVSRSLGELSSRVERLEADVTALRGGVAAPPAPAPVRTYTVVPGDTLSGIAARLGLGDWRRLYEANVAVIGPDPNRIYPGQVLVVP
jgi:LysM repeat protein